jgi:branched-chain amino acid transport system permease protein
VAIAAVLITLLNEWLRDFSEYRMVIYALIIILFMILRPAEYLAPYWYRIRRRLNPFTKKVPLS